VILHHPYAGTVTTASGPQKIPFHCYDSNAVSVECWVDFSVAEIAVRQGTMGQYFPVKTDQGKAIGRFYFSDYKDSTCGSYLEVIYMVWVSKDPSVVIPSTTYEALMKLALNPTFKLYEHVLWLNKKVPVDYGREILGCPKFLSPDMALTGEGIPTTWNIPGILSGSFFPKTSEREKGIVAGELVRAFGLPTLQAMAAAPWISYRLVNQAGVIKSFPFAPESDLEFYCPKMEFQPWDNKTDKLTAHDQVLQTWNVSPFMLTLLPNSIFTFLPPWNLAQSAQ